MADAPRSSRRSMLGRMLAASAGALGIGAVVKAEALTRPSPRDDELLLRGLGWHVVSRERRAGDVPVRGEQKRDGSAGEIVSASFDRSRNN